MCYCLLWDSAQTLHVSMYGRFSRSSPHSITFDDPCSPMVILPVPCREPNLATPYLSGSAQPRWTLVCSDGI